jgi:hypothetical protein
VRRPLDSVVTTAVLAPSVGPFLVGFFSLLDTLCLQLIPAEARPPLPMDNTLFPLFPSSYFVPLPPCARRHHVNASYFCTDLTLPNLLTIGSRNRMLEIYTRLKNVIVIPFVQHVLLEVIAIR